MRIRSHLLLFAAFSVLPVLAFSLVMGIVFWQQQRHAVERGFLERVRAMAIALDREHTGIIQVLGALPSLGNRAYFRQLVATVQPVVSNLQREPFTGEYATYVGIPVSRQSKIRYALFAVVVQPTWLRLMGEFSRAPGATVTLLDRDRLIIARTLNNERWLGQPPAQALYDNALERVEGVYRSIGLEGQWFYSAHRRAEVSGWTVATGVPVQGVENALRKSAAVLLGGAALSIGLAVGLALVFGRRIARPVASLAEQAISLGRGRPLQESAPPSGVAEVEAVAAALQHAGVTIESREAERGALLGREQAARAEAEAANRAKDAFLAILSHELRTPMNAAYGWARMLQGEQLEPDARRRALDAIVRNADAQVKLIDDLLDVSRIITGKMRLDVGPVDLEAVLEAALDAVRPAAEAKGVRLESVLDRRTGPVTGDSGRLQQVVWNLLMNAVKFTPRGGHVQLQLRRTNSRVEIIVSDTGQGIAPATLPRIFERFTQGDSSSTRAHGGLGVGLALVRHLVELHGGSVVAHSPGEGQGATFVVSLPVSLAAVHEPATPVTPAGAETRPHLDGIRLLVVDDDRDALDLATLILTGAGAEVKTAASAPEALHVFGWWRPDVLLCDIEMPGEDGYSLIRKIRALAPALGGRTPAIAVTAYGRAEDRVRSISAGFNMHVPKPVDPTELQILVAGLASAAVRS
jgi:signal transduction histidine kinase/ActR/RegA family two-component response regulator